MGRYLVMANQTLEGQGIFAEVRKRQEKEPSSFYVVVPNTRAVDYYGVPAAGGHVPMPTLITASSGPATNEEATAEARGRLGRFLARLRELGAQAEGELGDPDPLKAAVKALTGRQFDEIIVSTLPQPASRWLRMNFPRELQQQARLPVTVILART
ncbi:MAG TPA: hypothetical protein VKV80_03605 [Streptosporangiaceae bacterium]|nr:hypothetical protein [Streptosporangiaceae bacterium]